MSPSPRTPWPQARRRAVVRGGGLRLAGVLWLSGSASAGCGARACGPRVRPGTAARECLGPGNGMASQDAPKGRRARDPTVAAINRIRKEREARRQSAEHYHRERRAEERRNIREGKPGDVDFQRLISNFRREHAGKSRKVRRRQSGRTASPAVDGCSCAPARCPGGKGPARCRGRGEQHRAKPTARALAGWGDCMLAILRPGRTRWRAALSAPRRCAL